jgi:hypothetical protein
VKILKFSNVIILLSIIFLIGCDARDKAILGLFIVKLNIWGLLLCAIIGIIGLLIAITIYCLGKKNINYQLKMFFGVLLIIISVITYAIPYRFSRIQEITSFEEIIGYGKLANLQYIIGYLYNTTIGYLIIIILCSILLISGIVSIIIALKDQSLIEAPAFLKDLWGFLKVRKKYWLLPIIITLLLFGSLFIFVQGTAIAPFIYQLF